MERPSEVPGVATARLRDQLAGPARPGVLVHAGPDAAYVDLGERCVGVLSARAVHVPCGIRTTLAALPPLDRAMPVVVGDRALTIGPLRVRITRLVDLRVPPASRLASLAPQPPDAELPPAALEALHGGDVAAVPALLGRGSGLTPLGDDVLCGWLATNLLLDDPARPAIAAEATRLARERTTRLSAELIACAVAGETVPEFRRLLAAGPSDLDAALADLVQIGHTSGAGLALGWQLALHGAEHRRAAA